MKCLPSYNRIEETLFVLIVILIIFDRFQFHLSHKYNDNMSLEFFLSYLLFDAAPCMYLIILFSSLIPSNLYILQELPFFIIKVKTINYIALINSRTEINSHLDEYCQHVQTKGNEQLG